MTERKLRKMYGLDTPDAKIEIDLCSPQSTPDRKDARGRGQTPPSEEVVREIYFKLYASPGERSRRGLGACGAGIHSTDAGGLMDRYERDGWAQPVPARGGWEDTVCAVRERP